MKKLSSFILLLIMVSNTYCQTFLNDDNQLKKILVDENSFGNYIQFNENNKFISKFRTWGGDGYSLEGEYKIEDGVISFFNVKNSTEKSNIIYTDTNGKLNFDHQFKYSSDTFNSDFIGCLIDMTDNSFFWTIKKLPENTIYEINGVKVYSINNNCIYINENLKMRNAPDLKADTVFIDGADYDFGYVSEKRKVIFAGTVIKPIAKTVEESTIDGLTAPWYYVKQISHDPASRYEGTDYYVWIFGGYVKVCESGTCSNEPEVLKSVKSAGLKFKYWNF